MRLSSGPALSCQGTRGCRNHEEDVFLDGLFPLPPSSSEASKVASAPREHAQYGLRDDRIGEADHPGPEKEGERDGRGAWLNALSKPTTVGDSLPCRESGIFLPLLGELQTEEAKRMGFKDGKRLDTLVSRAIWAPNWMHGEFSRSPACVSSGEAKDFFLAQAVAAED